VVTRHEDGRLDIETSGRRRFEIESIVEERSFLQARVEFFDDDSPATAATPDIGRWKLLWRELSEIAGVENEPRWDDPQLSFQLATAIPELSFRQTLLGMRDESRRMREIEEFYPVYLNQQRHIHHVHSVAPRNGHGKKKIEEL
jgi:Lon protease-like protein